MGKSTIKLFLTRIRNKIRKIKWFFDGEIDARLLSKVFQDTTDYKKLAQSDAYQMKSVYERYIREISCDLAAVSWETAHFLYTIAKIRRCRKILDLGSGFSSYVLRTYAMNAHNGVCVHSIDDDNFWLGKTKLFLADYGVPLDHLTTWECFKENNQFKFDLIFHDLGNMETRAKSLPFVLNLLEKGGVIVLDDMHKTPYRYFAKKEVRKAGLSLYSIRKHTLDKFSRFSGIGISRDINKARCT